uniref:Integron gene cassette protein n=1 Tax=Macrostomum lignano TaxID=282301 RepID=A0A1I8I5P4_9PLAT
LRHLPGLNVNSRFCPTKFPNFPNIAPSVRQVKSATQPGLRQSSASSWRTSQTASPSCSAVSDCNSKKFLTTSRTNASSWAAGRVISHAAALPWTPGSPCSRRCTRRP